MKRIFCLALVAVIFMTHPHDTSGHMRMLDPTGRPSMWRNPDLAYLNPTQIANDDEMWCDNIRQYETDTRCGICGDPVSDPTPRANEYGGAYWRDAVVKNYTSGQVIPIHLESYAPHGGGIEVQFCGSVPETEDCFKPMILGNGDTYIEYQLGEGHFDIQTTAQLPAGVTCDRCVIRMHYRGAQNWGTCDSSRTCECDPNSGNPPGGMGCGEQQTFRACADISIH